MRSKHIVMVIHGSRADYADVRHLVSWVREKGHFVEPLVTYEAGDAAAFAADAARRGVDVVAAVGGDGTVNEVVNGLDGYDVPLGVIPVGTANDFAQQVGIPADADHAMDVILQRKPRRLDTASLNGRRFLNVSSGGVGAEATAETPTEAKESLGAIAYAITGMRKLADLHAQTARFVGDGFEYEGEFLMFAVGLTRASGGGTMVTPMASATDGLLDLCIVGGMSRADFARIVLRVKRGDHIGEQGVQYAQLRSVTIEAREPIAVNVDGESSNAKRLVYRARARDLWAHVATLPGESET
ncbi:MAG TPA: YegS/Rv2252/BmrU family lipid kinase [Gemmatimonadaceae bacterium]|nr:YegS/Rv2252/BmrU family lipid kinase [Gemmatimonadaceae bacterium]